jgi:hypothetical protein
MAGIGNPQVSQGTLNRIRTHVVPVSFPNLQITASYMGKDMAEITFDDVFVDQEPTGTWFVNSPRPFVMGTLSVTVLRSQSLGNLWLAQIQLNAQIGDVATYADSAPFQTITLGDCSVTGFAPGKYDGGDPGVKLTLKGGLYVNGQLWSPTPSL